MNSAIKALCYSIALTGLGLSAQAKENNNDEAGNAISRGATAWAQNCGRCHNHRGPQEFRPDQWQPIMAHMRIQAGITGQTAKDILAFLEGESPSSGEASNAKHGEAKKMTPSMVKTAFRDHQMMEEGMGEGHMGPGMMTPAHSEGSKSGGKAPKGSYNEGKVIFMTKGCAACHGNTGKGNIPQAPNFTAPNSVLKTMPEDTLVERVKDGYKMMPAHPELSDQQIEDVIAFMKKKFAEEKK